MSLEIFSSVEFQRCVYALRAINQNGIIVVSSSIDGVEHVRMSVQLEERLAQIECFFDKGMDKNEIFSKLVTGHGVDLEQARSKMVKFFMLILKMIALYFKCTALALFDRIERFHPPFYISWFSRHFGFFAAQSNRLSIDEAVDQANRIRETNKTKYSDKNKPLHTLRGYYDKNDSENSKNKFQNRPRVFNIFSLTPTGDSELAFNDEKLQFVKRMLVRRGILRHGLFLIRKLKKANATNEYTDVLVKKARRPILLLLSDSINQKNENYMQFRRLVQTYGSEILKWDRYLYACPPDSESIGKYMTVILNALEGLASSVFTNDDQMAEVVNMALPTLNVLTFDGSVLANFFNTWMANYIRGTEDDVHSKKPDIQKIRIKLNFYIVDIIFSLLNTEIDREQVPFYNGSYIHSIYRCHVKKWTQMLKTSEPFCQQGISFEEKFSKLFARAPGISSCERMPF